MGQKGVALTMHSTVQSGRVAAAESAAQGLSSPLRARQARGKRANAPHGRSVLYGRDEHHVVKAIALQAAKLK